MGRVSLSVKMAPMRFYSAPLTAYFATKEMDFGTNTDGRNLQRCRAYRADFTAFQKPTPGSLYPHILFRAFQIPGAHIDRFPFPARMIAAVSCPARSRSRAAPTHIECPLKQSTSLRSRSASVLALAGASTNPGCRHSVFSLQKTLGS